jgi:esterase/lipase superfamily enzyme
MELLVFGHGGARVLVFPTSMGRFYEWEDRGMVAALGGHLVNGWLQLICVDSVDSESWYADWAHPAQRAARHAQYERYLLEEVLPFSTNRNPDPYLIATGASFGAYHAANRWLSDVLWSKGIWHALRVWDGWCHDWPWWHQMLTMYIGGG